MAAESEVCMLDDCPGDAPCNYRNTAFTLSPITQQAWDAASCEGPLPPVSAQASICIDACIDDATGFVAAGGAECTLFNADVCALRVVELNAQAEGQVADDVTVAELCPKTCGLCTSTC
eukprot:6190175-Pleurochrysis_carterae.AAC.2